MIVAADLDVVTLDALGTLVELADPVPGLRRALAAHGVEREDADVGPAFAAEVDYYLPRAHKGGDPEALTKLRRDCAAVFLEACQADLDPTAFAPDFDAAIEFRLLPDVVPALDALQAAGFSLACVANWDISLTDHLEGLGLTQRFQATVSSAEAGSQKPDPRPFELALERLGVPASRALHCGDSDADREGAARAGLAFEPDPVATLPERLGIR
ncbi:MAG TPA: HAD-IA family hydrolase [Gaiellaceae bacterium]|nr:HAD-IA family hydrolase [Gaiellaceae bacterium]